MNAQKLYKSYVAWAPYRDILPFDGGRVLHDSINGVVIVPADAPETIVKILHPHSKPCGLFPSEEFARLGQIQRLTNDEYVLPVPISRGDAPHHIQMTRIGTVFENDRLYTPKEIAHIGSVTGRFASRLFTEFGAVHMDLCRRNITRLSDSRLGFIDIASVKMGARNPEDMFLMPLVYESFPICPAMAAAFTKETGIKINLTRLERIIEKSISLPGIKAQQLNNLDMWKRRRAVHAQRVCAKAP